MRHSDWGYQCGCRCEVCRAARADYVANRRARLAKERGLTYVPRPQRRANRGRRRLALREELLSHLIIDPSGCVLWDDLKDRDGYGRINIGSSPKRVHRVMWEMSEGPIPEYMELDHVKARGCANRHCASIAHLELVTHAENMRRARQVAAEKKQPDTHCRNGHEWTPENTYVNPASGECRCRACWRAAALRCKANKKLGANDR